MCGICGAVDFGGLDAAIESHLAEMVRVLRHRGPDQSGTFRDAHAALGHARLSIIDLSDGRQPMCNEDGTVWVSYNGEIYNFRELRAELAAKGHKFRTRTDTEVIVHLYEEEGVNFVSALRGMFAMAVWDALHGELYLVRDRVGIKPLYYAVHNGRLIFASEIKAILAHGGVPKAVRPDALSDYVTFLYVPAPKTMFKDIFKLPAGHWLRFSRTGLVVRQYWDLRPSPAVPARRADVEARLVELLGESVKMHLVSDVPLGAFLSGGIDSSAVVAMMALAGQQPLVTSTVGFNEGRYSELPYARRVAGRYGTAHHEQIVTPRSVEVVEKLAWHYDEPFADDSSVPTYYVSRAARQFVTVALSGDGGDENFAGYRRYRFDMLERRIRGILPSALCRWLVRPLAMAYPKADWLPRPLRARNTLMNIASDAPIAYCRSVGFLADEQKPAFLSADVVRELGDYRSSEIIRDLMNTARKACLDEASYTDIKTYLAEDILAKVDRASMAVSLEVRVPLLDHRFMEFAAGVPLAMKIDGRGQKSILKSALRPFLDDETLRRRKRGFTPPTVGWLRGPLREMAADLLLSPRAFYRDYFNAGAVRKAWSQHLLRLRNYAPLLWAVMMFELWGRTFMTSDVAARPAEVVA